VRQKGFGLCKIHRQHSEVVSNSFELRLASSIRGEKQFLKHDRVHSETNAAFRLRREQLRAARSPLRNPMITLVPETRAVASDPNLVPVMDLGLSSCSTFLL